MTAFVPLIIFSQFISPFHFGKVVVFRSIVEILAVFYFILILQDRRWLPPKHALLTAFVLFTFVFGVTSIISINPYLSFWGSLERMGGWWSFLHYLVYFIILTGVFKTREDWLRLTKLMVFVGVLSAFYGFGQKTNIDFFIGSGNRARIFGTIGNAALFAGYQIVNLFLALTLALSSWVPNKQKGYLWLAVLINTVAVLMTAVRGSILGMVVGFLLFAFLYVLQSHSKAAKKALGGLVILAVLFVAFSLIFHKSKFVQNSPYLVRLTDISFSAYTVQTRFWAWHSGLSGWNDNAKTILFGWGPENFNVPFSINFNPKHFRGPGSETLFDRAHNQFVEVLVTMGLVGLGTYVAIFVIAIKLLWERVKKKRPAPHLTWTSSQDPRKAQYKLSAGLEAPVGLGLIVLIVAYMIHNSFIFDTSANFLVFFTVLGFVSWLALTDKVNPKSEIQDLKQFQNPNFQNSPQPKTTHNQKPINSKLSTGQQTLLLILLIGAIYLIYKTNILQSKANYATTRAIVKSWNNDFDGALAKYKEALSYDVPGKYEYRHRYAQWILEYTSGKKLDDKLRAALEFAIQEAQKNIDETKLDYLPYLYRSRAHIVLGKDDPKSQHNDLALQNSLKALEIAPNFVRTYYEVAQAYLNKKDYENGIKYFQKAAELNPEVGLSWWYLGATYLETGDAEKAFAALGEAQKVGYDLTDQDILRLISYYIKQENYVKIAELYETLLARQPKNPQYHASAASAYARSGNIDKAVEHARAAAAIDKTFELEAREFVRSLGREL